MAKKMVIACFDGGGIKGLLQASFLAEMDNDVQSLYHTFDLFAGSSVGSMVAALICANKCSGKETLQMFTTENIHGIFQRNSIFSLAWLVKGAKYSGVSKSAVLRKIFGEQGILDVDKDMLIPAYNWIVNEAKVFKSSGGKDAESNPSVASVVDASSAAPTFFPSVKIGNDWLADGSLASNNPSMIACAYALHKGYDVKDVYIFSLGSGAGSKVNLHVSKQDVIGRASLEWGAMSWLKNDLIGDMINAPARIVDYQCRKLLQSNYLRIDDPGVSGPMDDISSKNLAFLRETGKLWYQKYRKSLLEWLGKAKS